MILRPRQRLFVDRCVEALIDKGNTLGVGPTGFGKTVVLSAIAGEIIKQLPRPRGEAVILQHTDELVAQNRRTFERVNPGLTTGLYTAGAKEWGYGATFAMAPTLGRDNGLANMPRIDFLAIDEGHHAAANGYRKIIARAKETNENLKLLLLTATAGRGDKKGLRTVVDNCADQVSLKELIEEGHLVRPRTFVIDLGVNDQLQGVRKTINDFDMSAVEQIMDKDPINERVVEEWRSMAGNRQTVVFCSTVAHALHTRDSFRAAGVVAETIFGDMAPAERVRVLAAYDRGEIQVITNVAVLTEGWDHQPTSCIILLRPSSFKSTMIQMIGRGLRKVDPERYPGVHKDDCIVLDFGISILKHGGIEQDVDLDGSGVKACPGCASMVPGNCRECPVCGYEFPKPAFVPTKICPECKFENHLSARVCLGAACEHEFGDGEERGVISQFVMTEIDILEDSPYRWEGLGRWLGLPVDEAVMAAAAFDAWALCLSYHGRWYALGGGKETGLKLLCDAESKMLALASADDFLREHGDKAGANKNKRWLYDAATPNQIARLGIPPEAAFGLTKYQAACRLEWKFNQAAIRRKLEGMRGIAA